MIDNQLFTPPAQQYATANIVSGVALSVIYTIH